MQKHNLSCKKQSAFRTPTAGLSPVCLPPLSNRTWFLYRELCASDKNLKFTQIGPIKSVPVFEFAVMVTSIRRHWPIASALLILK
jgi:hypothetical protein